MEKLDTDCTIKIMISMKEMYEKQIKRLEQKYDSLGRYILDIGLYIEIRGYDNCSVCGHPVYNVMEDEEQTWNTNFVRCNRCNKIGCFACLANTTPKRGSDFITEFFNNPLPNKFWCKSCNDFNKLYKS